MNTLDKIEQHLNTILLNCNAEASTSIIAVRALVRSLQFELNQYKIAAKNHKHCLDRIAEAILELPSRQRKTYSTDEIISTIHNSKTIC